MAAAPVPASAGSARPGEAVHVRASWRRAGPGGTAPRPRPVPQRGQGRGAAVDQRRLRCPSRPAARRRIARGWWRCRRPPARAGRQHRGRVLACATSADGRPEPRGEVERAALAGLALDPDPAAHQLDQLRRDGQPQAGAAVLARRRAVGLGERRRRSASCLSAGMPMPCRGRRSAGRPRRPACSSSRHAGRRPRPRSVNLMALPTRLTSTCRSRPGSPTSASGTSGATWQASSRPFVVGPQGQRLERVVERRRAGRSRSGSRSSLPASILEKSRMSLMTASSDSADVFDHAEVLALLGRQLGRPGPARSCR